MANSDIKKIQIKRGLSSKVPQLVLDAGELAIALDTGKLYSGDGEGNVVLLNPAAAAADTAAKLATARTISLTGDATGSVSFDGSANAPITVVLANTGVAAGTYTKLTIDAKGRVLSAAQQTAADIPNLTLTKITDAGTAASKNTGTAAGNVPVLDSNGKLDGSIMPPIAITQAYAVASQAAMLALDVQIGDIAVRSDVAKNFILRAEPASTLANWLELAAPASSVSSVAGKTGAVTLASSDVGLGNVTNVAQAPATHVGASGSGAHPDATTSTSGFMTAAMVLKLNGVAQNATVNRSQATQAQAEAGTDSSTDMSPLRVAQAITAQTAVIDGGTF
ncbi:hyaluronate lyase N-terminal domain-containing protein [Paenibacillus sp. FSL R7-0333]|uniref:hyaluronate lyase N-terminal domain-containing protein n=1 Tax=Paenibacillus sp. FSL R7-0333 TaxID=1926587 RepID=UPI00096C1454|nr:hypothetical protein BK146_16685 [Paenibacillus sp. FSL R7-0333]